MSELKKDRFDADRQRFLDLIRTWHSDHPRPDQVEHCINVMDFLKQALEGESASDGCRRAMLLAALGHDLYEDTAIERDFVVANFGPEVDRFIEGVTERAGVAEFVERVASGPEEARLIKLSDGIDNYESLVRNGLVRAKPADWVETVRKQMEPMFSRLASLPFLQYPTAGKLLSERLAAAREGFWAEVHAILSVKPST